MDIMEISLLALTVLAALSSAALLWLIRNPKTSRALDFLVGIQLIVFAAFFLGLLGSLRNLISDNNELKAGYDVALLIIPFFTAGLGTNILSHVVLSDRNYEGTISTPVIGKKMVRWMLILAGVVFPPILIGYALYLKKSS
ncbi:TPA: hypothetical protein U8251_000032 [Pseudomonas putida]|nr:hypothetical protein [Pseudomonas putida]